MTKKEIKKQQIINHVNNLIKLFELDDNYLKTEEGKLKLFSRLKRLENKGKRVSTALCNGEITEKEYEKKCKSILHSLDKLLNFSINNFDIVVNGEPRGYSLIIEDYERKYGCRNIYLYRDWGGSGIIVPNF